MNYLSNYSVTRQDLRPGFKQVAPLSIFAEHALAVAHAYSKKEYQKAHDIVNSLPS